MSENQLYTVADICKKLIVSKNTLYQLIKEKKINAIKVGNTYRVSDHELSVFYEKNSTI